MRVAPLRLRLFAAVVDVVVYLGGTAALSGLGIAGVRAYARVRGKEGGHDVADEQGADEDEESSGVHRMVPEFCQSPRLRDALPGALAGLAIANRNSRSRGFRVVGLRRVDARTGGLISVRSALIGVFLDRAREAATRLFVESGVRRQRDRLRVLRPQLKMIQRKYGDDPKARQRALKEFYKVNHVSPAGCAWLLVAPVVSQLISALGSRGGRTLRDRITGTAVVVDR